MHRQLQKVRSTTTEQTDMKGQWELKRIRNQSTTDNEHEEVTGLATVEIGQEVVRR